MSVVNLKSWVMLMVLFTVGAVSALPIYVSPLDGEDLQPGVNFSYVFNFTTGSDCSGVLLSSSSDIMTGKNGVGFVDIDISSLSVKPDYLCEYRDGSLRKIHSFSDMVLEDVWVNALDVGSDLDVSGALDVGTSLDVGSNLDVVSSGFFGFLGSLIDRINKIWVSDIDASGSITAGFFIGDGSGLINLNLSGVDTSGLDADLLDGLDSTVFYNASNPAGYITSADVVDVSDVWVNTSGDTMTGVLDMGANKITGLSNGTAAQDAVTKSQLDAISAGASSDSDLLDGYDSSFFMPLNTSVVGDFDFNGGWAAGGLSIVNGDLYAQTAYLYNLTSLAVNTLNINGSIVPAAGFDDAFDLGSASLGWRDLYLGGEVRADGTGDNYFMGNLGIGVSSSGVKLHLYADTLGVWEAIQTNGTDVDANLQLQTQTGGWIFKTDGSDNQKLNIITSGGIRSPNITMFTIQQDGNVGIGTTSPSDKLEVNGSISVTSGNDVCVQGGICLSTVGSGSVGGTGTANYLSKWTAGSTIGNSVIYDDGSKVGIGTASPDELLDIRPVPFSSNQKGGIKISDTGNNWDFGIYLKSDGSGIPRLSFKGDNKEDAMVIDGDGKVGIGTSSPDAKLEVNGDIIFGSGNPFRSSANVLKGAVGQNGIFIRSAISSEGNPSYSNIDDINTGMFLPGADVLGLTTGGTERMRIDSAGNVGIGLTAPDEKLHVASSTGAKLQLERVDSIINGGNVLGDINFAGDEGSDRYVSARIRALTSEAWDATGKGSDLTFSTTASNTEILTERMRIDASGNVGIGTTSPGAKLEITSTNSNHLRLEHSTGFHWSIYRNAVDGNLKFDDSINGNAMTIEDTGNVGIGTSTPGARLDIFARANDASNPGFKLDTLTRTAGDTVFEITGSSGTNGVYVKNDGKVGIGTTGPGVKLHVSTTAAEVIRAERTGSSANVVYTAKNTAGSTYFGRPNGGFFGVGPNLDLASGPYMSIDTSGDVGIGTTSPSGSLKLDVEGAVGATQYCDETGANCIDIADVVYGNTVTGSLQYTSGSTEQVDKSAFVDYSSTMTELAGAGWNWGFHVEHGNDNGYGMTLVRDQTGKDLYYRNKDANVYSQWYEIWSEKNDGAGSGLDADLLDGITSASFLRSDADDSMGGRLTISSGSNGNAYNLAPLEIYESWASGAGEGPHISFHYGGSVASQIGFMKGDSSGDISILDNPGTGYETLRVRDLKIGTTAIIDGSRNLVNVGSATLAGTLNMGNNAITNINWAGSDDGAGSGLDADLLDGVTSAWFVRSNADDTVIRTLTFTDADRAITATSTGFTSTTIASSSSGASGTGLYGGATSSTGETFGIRATTTSSSSGSYGIYCTANGGKCGGNKVWSGTSDGRFKDNVTTISDALEKVKALRGVTFDWNNLSNATGHEMGFIAQESIDYIPEVVGQDKDGYYNMAYGPITALLTEAMKEQQVMIEDLQAENLELVARIDRIEGMLELG